ncbi:hypothetical protein OC861_003080 [Tilletia horrida]|nr:hypothetical protein OC861_003080 [Tilletia horrida]
MSNDSLYFFGANVPVEGFCLGAPGYSRLTFAPPYNPNVTRRCGHHGSAQLSTLSGCCGAGAQIDTLGSPGTCGYICPYNGTLQQWATCINNDTSLVFCVNEEITSDYRIGPIGSASRRANSPLAIRGMRWTTLFLAMFVGVACLMPTVAALPSASDALKMVTWSRRAGQGCKRVLLQDPPYLDSRPNPLVEHYESFGYDLKAYNLSSSAPQNVTAPTYTRPGRLVSSFNTTAGSIDQICRLLHPSPNDTTCDTTQLKGIKTSYEYWTKNGTLSVLFSFNTVFSCIDAQLGDCDTPQETHNGTFCATRMINSTAPLYLWAPSSEMTFQRGPA